MIPDTAPTQPNLALHRPAIMLLKHPAEIRPLIPPLPTTPTAAPPPFTTTSSPPSYCDSSSRGRNRLSRQPQNPPLYQLLLAPALNGMDYVEDTRLGCLYRTNGKLWECMDASDSRKWFAVVRGTSLGVFDNWYMQSLVITSTAI